MLTAAALLALAGGPAGVGAQTATIVGTVRDAQSGDPLRGASVLLRDTPLSTATDAMGRFAIRGLSAGHYTLHVTALGFSVDSLAEVNLEDGEQREVTLALDRIALRLQEVVVTASRVAERSEEAIASISVIPSVEIIERNITTIEEALLYVPGVSLNSGSQLDVRGATGMARGVGSRVLVLLDGHPILSGDGGEIDFGTIPMLDLDRSEVVKGAYSTLYGSNALSGVVNLLTKPIDSVPNTVVRAHAATYNYQQEYEWSDGRQGEIGLGLQHSRAIGSIHGRVALGYESTNGFSQNRESNRWLGRVKFTSAPTSRTPWDAFGILVRERVGEFFVWRSNSEPFLVAPSAAGDYSDKYTLLSGATVTPFASANTLVKLSPHFNFSRVQNHFSDNRDWHNAFKPGLLAQVSWHTGGRHSLTFGADAANTWVTSNFLGNPRIRDLAAFGQDEVRIARSLKGSFGVRLDHHKADAGEAEWALSPKAGIALRVAPRATIRASIGAGYRAPSAIEQFVSTRELGFQVIPNPELRGEHAWSGEVGTTLTLLDRARVDAAVFGSFYSDLIGPAPAAGRPFVFQFQNVSRARVAGIDVGINANVIEDKLEVQTGYLFLDTQDRDAGKALPYRSRHNLTGTITAFQGLAAVDVRYRSRVEEVLAYPLDPRGDVTVVDLRVGYRALDVLWQLKVANVFNQFFVDVQERNPGAPRSIGITGVRGI